MDDLPDLEAQIAWVRAAVQAEQFIDPYATTSVSMFKALLISLKRLQINEAGMLVISEDKPEVFGC